MKNLIEYLKEQGCITASVVAGPNGKFISATKQNGDKLTMPVGKKSQNGTLAEFNVLIAEDTKQAIATVNHYEEIETLAIL